MLFVGCSRRPCHWLAVFVVSARRPARARLAGASRDDDGCTRAPNCRARWDLPGTAPGGRPRTMLPGSRNPASDSRRRARAAPGTGRRWRAERRCQDRRCATLPGRLAAGERSRRGDVRRRQECGRRWRCGQGVSGSPRYASTSNTSSTVGRSRPPFTSPLASASHNTTSPSASRCSVVRSSPLPGVPQQS